MSRAKPTRKQNPKRGRRAARKAARPARSARRPVAARAAAAPRPAASRTTGWSTLRVVWRPAIAMATLPYRVYRVYRWAEAEQARAASV